MRTRGTRRHFLKPYRRADQGNPTAINPGQLLDRARRSLPVVGRELGQFLIRLRQFVAAEWARDTEKGLTLRRIRVPRSAFQVLAVAFWAAATARLASTYSGPGLHLNVPLLWAIIAAGYLLGVLLWFVPRIRIPAEQLIGAVVIGISIPLLYLSIFGNVQSNNLPSVVIAAAILTAALLPLRTAMAAALLGAVAAAIPLLAGWTAYYDRSLLVLVSVIGLLTYTQARMTGTLGKTKRQAENDRRQMEESYVATISALAASIFAKDGSAESHSRGSAALAVAVARRMGLSHRQLQLLEYAAILQDVGKVGLPGAVLSKPGRLTDQELGLIRQHPVIAERILSVVPALAPITPVIRAQYERWNGSGFPDGLAGHAIPLGARILHVCSAFNAMAIERATMSRDAILAELREQAGKQFDPDVVAALTAVVQGGEVKIGGPHPASHGLSAAPHEWVQQLESLEGLGSRLGREKSIDQICRAVAETVMALVPYDQCSILVMREEGGWLLPAYRSWSDGAESAGKPAPPEILVGEGIPGWVAETRKGVVVGDVNKHPKAGPARPTNESMVAAPVLFKADLLGVIVVSKLGLNRYTGDHLRLLTILANQLGASIANARMIERLDHAGGSLQSVA